MVTAEGTPYYVHRVTGESAWKRPDVGVWAEVLDSTGRTYYMNETTGVVNARASLPVTINGSWIGRGVIVGAASRCSSATAARARWKRGCTGLRVRR